MSQLWQHPFVNVFKHFDLASWKKASKEGEVSSLMDKTLKCTVYKISGSIPAGNYIQLPKTSSQSLGLTGRYFYLLFKPVPGKYFVVHMDVATLDGLVIRISFSNLFKEFKSTSTWLQFPFVCHAAKGSVSDHAGTGSKDHGGPAPLHTRYSVLCLDFQYILSTYVNRKYSYIKTVKLCANMIVKNIITSDCLFEPGLTVDQVRRLGLPMSGKTPMPREMAFPLTKTQKWNDVYDIIRFPADGTKKPFDSIQFADPDDSKSILKGGSFVNPQRVPAKTIDVSRPVQGRPNRVQNAMLQQHGKKGPRKKPVSELPMVGVDENGEIGGTSMSQLSIDQREVHVYAHPSEPLKPHKEQEHYQEQYRAQSKSRPKEYVPQTKVTARDSYQALQPDPIIQLRRIVGFGGATTKDALWSSNGVSLVYPCHAVVVAMQVSNGHQRFFIGHTDKVASISMNGNSTLLASGQTGPQSVVRVWKFQSAECLAMFKTHVHSLHCLSMSHSGGVLCGVGKDNHGKNMVVIWNTERVNKGGQVSVMAKAHTDVDIARMRISAFDDTRMVSCGRDNIRLWRVKDGNLRSAPVNLGEYHSMEFTDCCFEAGYEPTKDPLDRMVYACSKSGHIFEMDYRKVAIQHVRRLLPVDPKKKDTKQAAGGLAINSMCVNEAFCVTGSDDGFLRLCPLDFKQVYLEAEHEGPVTAVHISADGLKILAGTSTGNVGVLDVSTRGYTTVMRSHTAGALSMAVDPIRRHLATVARDHTIRVWDLDTMQQLYDFSAPKEVPCAITYHPRQQVFACGFESGAVRVFSVASTSMLAEHRQHRGKVTGIAYSPDGNYLYSSGSLGSVALYDAKDDKYLLLRVLANTAARGERYGPHAVAVNPDGRTVAFVGPSEFTVSVVNSRSLDEVIRIDISSLAPDSHRGGGSSASSSIDTAVRVMYSPASVKQLLVTTANNKLLKFDARNGKIVAELGNIHRSGCTAIDVSPDGRHLATAGDKVIKIWDYHMRLDLNFQVFIGHAESIQRLCFAPDQCTFISTGDCIFIWDFLAHKGRDHIPQLEGRTTAKSYYTGEVEEYEPYESPAPIRQEFPGGSMVQSDMPRSRVPQPTAASALYEPGEQVANISDIRRTPGEFNDLQGEDIISVTSDREDVMIGPELQDTGRQQEEEEEEEAIVTVQRENNFGSSRYVEPHRRPPGTPPRSPAKTADQMARTQHKRPDVFKHFSPTDVRYALAQRRYTAPPNMAGLKLRSVLGYNGNGRSNMVWHPDTGMFAYSSGCTVIVEELDGGKQQHLLGHNEEVSTMALQHDSQVLASASGSRGISPSQIILWDLQTMLCKTVLNYHPYNIVCLAYSRDDRFLVSVGDYEDCSIAVWSATTFDLLTTTKTSVPTFELRWDPTSCNEFASVGADGSILFWLLDETAGNVGLNVHEADIPREVTQQGGKAKVWDKTWVDCPSFTSLAYGGDSTLYVGSHTGQITAWDTRHNTCCMHWQADNHEIVLIVCKNGRMVTCSKERSLKIWSGVGELRDADTAGITMEDEMMLDGGITTAAFDDTMDMGIVGTDAGTLWYINWTERTSIRLVSGHASKVLGVSCHGSEYLATAGEDGGLRVWSLTDTEQMLQFQVMNQPCNCVAFAPSSPVHRSTKNDSSADAPFPSVAAGYGDGTVRMFDLNKVEMVLKMHPHAAPVTAISFSSDGGMILSGSEDGLVAVSSPATGMTVRVISDHRGAPIQGFDVTTLQEADLLLSGTGSGAISAPQLWLAASSDRRVSVWSADWAKDFCELVDWLTFPAPAFLPEDNKGVADIPPTLACFSQEEPDIVVYTGYGMQKQIHFYSLSEKKVLRSCALTHWARSLHVSLTAPLIVIGNNERLLKLMDYFEGSFQDFTGHKDSVHLVKFTADSKRVVTVAHNELMLWDVMV